VAPPSLQTDMIERVFAAIALAVCAVMLLRLLLGERRRYRFDAATRRVARALQRAPGELRRRRSTRRAAEKVANDAINRARGRPPGEWDGNVFTPKSTRKPPRDKMH
jgi:hypothetical protein